ncbi:acyl-ACP desaturase [Entomobacter blattae]|uniref:Rubrerythrin family protein n=1 Tax=Entomobacter blattae TaxID=2762277 RepID=A0A7H1NPC2_9PROT|nr:ferritin-like domain-containing protein [Entomobacter blattae]QNT77632.1 hypothetical protein JGUZn3_03810 [Entomobacter blattae]
MKRWDMDKLDWGKFRKDKVDPDIVPIIKAASVVERNSVEYVIYLKNVFADDPEIIAAVEDWAVEEIQHGDALGKWASLADPTWDYQEAFARYQKNFSLKLDVDSSIRGSKTGELIARSMVETGTSSFYTALGDSTEEPALKELCRLIAADELRHYKLFYDQMNRYMKREQLNRWQRARIALGRVAESEDDELATAYHTTNNPPNMPYVHKRNIAAYMSRAMQYYQPHHFRRVVSMICKVIGFTPSDRVNKILSYMVYYLVSKRQHYYKKLTL